MNSHLDVVIVYQSRPRWWRLQPCFGGIMHSIYSTTKPAEQEMAPAVAQANRPEETPPSGKIVRRRIGWTPTRTTRVLQTKKQQ